MHRSSRLIVRAPLYLCFSLALGAAACSTQQAAPSAPTPAVAFTWQTPGQCQAPASVPVTFAVVSPKWQTVAGTGAILEAAAASNPQLAAAIRPKQELYEAFASAMRNDFFSLLTCKGFTTRGPFASYDEMVFPDRMASDLVLAPEIDLRLAVQSEPAAASLGGALLSVALAGRGPTSNKLKGQATLSGRVTVALRESVTDTRMWTRSIEVPAESFTFESENAYSAAAAPYYNEIVTGDPAFIAALGPRLAAIYAKALTAAWSYTDPQEMRLVKAQSQDPRRRAVSGIRQE